MGSPASMSGGMSESLEFVRFVWAPQWSGFVLARMEYTIVSLSALGAMVAIRSVML